MRWPASHCWHSAARAGVSVVSKKQESLRPGARLVGSAFHSQPCPRRSGAGAALTSALGRHRPRAGRDDLAARTQAVARRRTGPTLRCPLRLGGAARPASIKSFPSCARSAAPRCASSPSSPTRPRSTTSSSTWASRRHHPGSRPPAARRGSARCRAGQVRPPARTRVRIRSTHHLVTPSSIRRFRPRRHPGQIRASQEQRLRQERARSWAAAL